MNALTSSKRSPASTPTAAERREFLERTDDALRRWSRHIDHLMQSFGGQHPAPPTLASKLESLRNKRDTATNKLAALKHGQRAAWGRATRELEDAVREMRDAWRSVLATLGREDLFV